MHRPVIIKIIGIAELLVAFVALASFAICFLLSTLNKPSNVFVFVVISNIISASLGIGILRHREWARATLIFFSGYIIITKLLIFSQLLHFSGEILVFIPPTLKNALSIVYHGFLIVVLRNPAVKKYFN
ncbi:MAG: hypothetical protein JW844_04805 [Candidatus Omnitrophica bacterium]|nr:hypothetical protein [Candidatus Omnitrophota bacterium]